MTFVAEIREALGKGQELFALDRGEYLNVYMWARNERLKGKDAGIIGSRSGEYIIWHEDYKESIEEPEEYTSRRVKVKGHYRLIIRDSKGKIVSSEKWRWKKND